MARRFSRRDGKNRVRYKDKSEIIIRAGNYLFLLSLSMQTCRSLTFCTIRYTYIGLDAQFLVDFSYNGIANEYGAWKNYRVA